MKTWIAMIFLFASVAGATTLNCETSLNLAKVAETAVETKGAQLVMIDDGAEAKSYISEKTPGFYTLEAYLYNYDMRIYSEGPIADGDRLSLSAWTRDVIYEVNCRIRR